MKKRVKTTYNLEREEYFVYRHDTCIAINLAKVIRASLAELRSQLLRNGYRGSYQTLKMHLDFGGKLSKNHFFVYTMSYYLPWRIQLQTAEEIIVRRRPCMT